MLPLVLLVSALALAVTSAAIGVAAAAVSQVELTRWVSYKLRGSGGAAGVLENPGRVLATANALTTIGTLCAAAVIPALLARTTPTVLGVFTIGLGVPLLVSATYLVPRVVGRRWAEPIVARAAPRLEMLGKLFAPFVPWRDPSQRTTLAAVLTNADTEALASADEMAVVSGVLAFADRPVRELMTPRTSIVAIPEGLLAAEAAHVALQSGYSRYPLYRGSLDEIVGVAHAFDLLHLSPDAPIPVHPALVVPGTTRAADLMLEMQRGRSHLAAVLDEFGGTAGLVTFEDLLRDLVSEIFEPAEPAGGGPNRPPGSSSSRGAPRPAGWRRYSASRSTSQASRPWAACWSIRWAVFRGRASGSPCTASSSTSSRRRRRGWSARPCARDRCGPSPWTAPRSGDEAPHTA